MNPAPKMKPATAQRWNVAASADTSPQQYVAYQGDGYNLTYQQAQEVAGRANAYPELVEALEGLLENAPTPKGIKKDFSYILYREAARRAIAKAKGRA